VLRSVNLNHLVRAFAIVVTIGVRHGDYTFRKQPRKPLQRIYIIRSLGDFRTVGSSHLVV
jgi:hypothetical protein